MARTVFNHGAYYVQWAFRSSAGYPMGILTSPDSPTPGADTDAYLMRNITSWTPPQVTYGKVTEKGGQKIRGQFIAPVTEIGTASFEMSSDDPVLKAYSNGSSIDSSTISGFKQYAPNINRTTFPAAFMVFSTRTMIIDDVALTTTYGWKHYVCPNAQLELQEAQISQADGENPNPVTGTVTLNKSYRGLYGMLFSAMGMNITENNEYFYVIETTNPIAISTYISNASNPETWTTAFLPLTTHATAKAIRLRLAFSPNLLRRNSLTIRSLTGLPLLISITAPSRA